jgi:hypothetical protein
MRDAVVCHGACLFGQVLPTFVLAEGGLVIVKTHIVTPQAHCARLLFCEAVCGTVVVEGIEVVQLFEVVHPYLRADAWGYKVAAQVFRPRHKIPFMIVYFIRTPATIWSTNNTITNIETCMKDGKSLVFSFMALGGRDCLRVRDLVMVRPPHVTAIGIEGVTTNFRVEEFMPGATIIGFEAANVDG